MRVAVGVLGLDDGAFFDEEAGEIDGLLERAAAIAPEVHDDALDVLLLEPVDEREHVFGGALRARRAAVLHVGVEGRQDDPAEPERGSIRAGPLDDFGLGFLLLEFDLVALDRDDLVHRRVGGARGDDL